MKPNNLNKEKTKEKALQGKVDAIIDDIHSVFGDTSVPRSTTRKLMEAISEAVETNLVALEDDE